MKKQKILGIVLALIGALLMFEGSILGENTVGIAIVIGIVGLVLIGTSSHPLFGKAKQATEDKTPPEEPPVTEEPSVS